jgi:ribonuclease HII
MRSVSSEQASLIESVSGKTLSSFEAAAPADSASPEIPSERHPRHHRRKRWTTIEKEIRARHGPLIAGVDEVGRGPLAGPVVACAVIMPPDMRAIAGVDDSKRLTAEQRVRLAVKIRQRALDWALGAASVSEIERFNIYQASVLAMRRALSRLKLAPNHVLIDGKTMRTLPVPHTAVVHGDARCFSIACASIIAKVTRDYLMARLALRHPAYTWETNVGYTTRAHVAGLASHGITRHHRRTFFRVSQLVLELDTLPQGEELIIVEDIAPGGLPY